MGVETWRVVTTRGETRTVTAELTIPATDHASARWLLTWDGGKSTAGIDADDDSDPREALCVWANYRVAEIRGPGELTTAERVLELEAALLSYAPKCIDCGGIAPQCDSPSGGDVCDACRLEGHAMISHPYAALLRSLAAPPALVPCDDVVAELEGHDEPGVLVSGTVDEECRECGNPSSWSHSPWCSRGEP